MLGSIRNEPRSTACLMVIAVAAVMIAAWLVGLPPSAAAPAAAPAAATEVAVQGDAFPWDQLGQGGQIFAKYDGVDGESVDENHPKWIDVLRVEWGAERPTAATGATRRRGAAVIDDLVITFDYEKASPKLEEALFKGLVIPKLEIEFTRSVGETRATYLRYELKNVLIRSFDIDGMADAGPPTVVVGNNFEEIKVTYTEYGADGSAKGNVEYSWKVEQGEV